MKLVLLPLIALNLSMLCSPPASAQSPAPQFDSTPIPTEATVPTATTEPNAASEASSGSPPTVLDWITAISSLVTPVVVLVLSALVARTRQRQEKLYEQQKALQDDRLAVYNEILEPYIVMATPTEILSQREEYAGKDSGEASAEIITTPEYKHAEFKLLLMGSDEVVESYNRLKQFYYAGKADGTEETTAEMLRILAELMLAIRRSVGYEKTNISYRDAVWWLIKDADKFF